MPEFIHTGKEKKKFVEKMFDDISDHYDFLNRILSFGIDRVWRKKLINSMDIENNQYILDVATGTGDVIFEINKNYNVTATGLDISQKMLDIAKKKLKKIESKKTKIEFIHGDAEKLPMGDNSYNHICIAFGFRNLGDYNTALKEFNRVLKPGGKLCILEFSKSDNKMFNTIFQIYFHQILPKVASLISRADAYRYLPESVSHFPENSEIIKLLEENHFKDIQLESLTLGVATIYRGIKN